MCIYVRCLHLQLACVVSINTMYLTNALRRVDLCVETVVVLYTTVCDIFQASSEYSHKLVGVEHVTALEFTFDQLNGDLLDAEKILAQSAYVFVELFDNVERRVRC